MRLRIALVVAAIVTLAAPWIWAYLKVAGSPTPGSKEDGPYTMATYVSVLTGPIALALVLVAFLVVQTKRNP